MRIYGTPPPLCDDDVLLIPAAWGFFGVARQGYYEPVYCEETGLPAEFELDLKMVWDFVHAGWIELDEANNRLMSIALNAANHLRRNVDIRLANMSGDGARWLRVSPALVE